jgi:hypothetical protein
MPLCRQVLAEAPRSYYGVLAARRVGRLTDVSIPAPITLPADPARGPGRRSVHAAPIYLRRLGLIEAALEELDDVVERAIGDPVRLYGLSNAYARDERYHLALRIHRRPLANLAASGDPALPRAFWETVYPFAWRSDVTAAAQRAGLEPYLVAPSCGGVLLSAGCRGRAPAV